MWNTRIKFGGVVLLALIVVAVFAPVIAPYHPIDVGTGPALASPSLDHILGTDDLGRDVFSRIIWGSRASLFVALLSALVGLSLGVSIGLASGYIGGWTDLISMRIIDTLVAFPALLLAIAIASVLGPTLRNAAIAIGVLSIPIYTLMTRGEVLSVRQAEFVLAARAMGVHPTLIVVRHVLPNVVGPIIVTATLWSGFAILTEAGLSYLGLGVQPPAPSWGQDIAYSQRQIFRGNWWPVLGPGAAIFTAVLAFNVLGDGLRDRFDPRRAS